MERYSIFCTCKHKNEGCFAVVFVFLINDPINKGSWNLRKTEQPRRGSPGIFVGVGATYRDGENDPTSHRHEI